MGRLARRVGALLASAVAAGTVATACWDDTSPAESGGGTTAADADVWPIDRPPVDVEVVDVGLVARVVAELDVHLADLHRAVVREGEVGELAEALAHSIYTADTVPSVLERLADRRSDLREDMSTPRSAIVELGTVRTDCVDALVRRDLAPVLDLPESEAISTWEVTLVVVDDSDNGTTWRMAGDEPGAAAPSGCG